MFPWTTAGPRRVGQENCSPPGGGELPGRSLSSMGRGGQRPVSGRPQAGRMGSEPWLSLAQGLSHVGITACVSDGGLDVTYLCGSDIWPILDGTVQLLYSLSPNSGQLLRDIFLR